LAATADVVDLALFAIFQKERAAAAAAGEAIAAATSDTDDAERTNSKRLRAPGKIEALNGKSGDDQVPSKFGAGWWVLNMRKRVLRGLVSAARQKIQARSALGALPGASAVDGNVSEDDVGFLSVNEASLASFEDESQEGSDDGSDSDSRSSRSDSEDEESSVGSKLDASGFSDGTSASLYYPDVEEEAHEERSQVEAVSLAKGDGDAPVKSGACVVS